ncbi:unnamed protein product [Lactuca saligna]|uniref:Uncharacterized protein n=1 Tax=Lactuca saligna TaxID=75948 RepID=A0AA36A3B8_LACSI|nr:unnamed protein product [Lactuca saligna]
MTVGVLLAKEDKKSKHGKKNESGSFEKSVKETKPTKSPKKKFVTIEEPIIHEVSIANVTPVEPTTVEETQKKEIIPSKTGVFRRLKRKSHHSRKSSPNVVRKPQVTHQGVLIHEVQVPVSPSSKKRKAEDMAKHLSKMKKKKSRKLVITNESTEEDEWILETPDLDLIKNFQLLNKQVLFHPKIRMSSHLMRRHELSTSLYTYLLHIQMSIWVKKAQRMKFKVILFPLLLKLLSLYLLKLLLLPPPLIHQHSNTS